MSTATTAFVQLMWEVKFGHTSTEEAAARLDAEVELRVEQALRARGIEPVPNGEQRLLRDLHNFGGEPG